MFPAGRQMLKMIWVKETNKHMFRRAQENRSYLKQVKRKKVQLIRNILRHDSLTKDYRIYDRK